MRASTTSRRPLRSSQSRSTGFNSGLYAGNPTRTALSGTDTRWAKLVKKDIEAIGVQAGQLPPERLPGSGFDRRLEPVRFLQRLDDLERLHAVACEPPVERQVQAQTTCILAEDSHGLGGRRPASGGDGAQAAWALLDKIRHCRSVFFAWLGRGRFSCALS